MQSNTLHWLNSRLAKAENNSVPTMVAIGTKSILGRRLLTSSFSFLLLPMPMPTWNINA